MTFILGAQRQNTFDVVKQFREYREYLARNRAEFPTSAYELANSDWYYDGGDPRCPHDAWLEEVRVEEPSTGERHEVRTVAIRVRLLGAYHNGHIELFYPRVFSYRLDSHDVEQGHRDWLYDEFRVDDAGRLIHEVEWEGARDTGRWLIAASDIQFTWVPHERGHGS